jgi:tetratricopeptide (TPR) repeat protein
MKLGDTLAAFALTISALALDPAGGAALGMGAPDPGSPGLSALIRRGDEADAQLDPNRALRCYVLALRESPNDPRILLKVAKEYSDSTLAVADPDESRRRVEKALEYTERAAELDPRNPVALLSKAICYGRLGSYCDTRDKIRYARLVKQYAEQALAADPNYAYAHHVLGQWEYEVASLGRTRRILAGLVYGGLPPASAQEGVRHLERAVELDPGTASHRLALGFAYLANGQPGKARESFEQVMAMPCREIYDADCHRQAERALAGL